MYLIAQDRDGTQTAASPNDIHAYGKALTEAEDHLRRHPETVALYLWTDNSSSVVRTYVRATEPPHRVAEVLFGLHEWPKPPTIVPGLQFPSDAPAFDWLRTGYLSPRDKMDWGDIPQPAPRHVGAAELEEADRLGYNRGFKVGIAHRNLERAAQLRRQADSLERIAGYVGAHRGPVEVRPPLYPYQEGAVEFALRANQIGKTWSAEEARQKREDYLKRHGVWLGQGTIAEPYYRSRRPEFSVDLGHNRR